MHYCRCGLIPCYRGGLVSSLLFAHCIWKYQGLNPAENSFCSCGAYFIFRGGSIPFLLAVECQTRPLAVWTQRNHSLLLRIVIQNGSSLYKHSSFARSTTRCVSLGIFCSWDGFFALFFMVGGGENLVNTLLFLIPLLKRLLYTIFQATLMHMTLKSSPQRP